MSSMAEKKVSYEEPGKDHVLTELGDVVAYREALSPQENQRILRKIDMQ